MQKVNLTSAVTKTLLLLFISVSSFSFIAPAGGDSYQIFLNKKLIMKQYVTNLSSTIMDLPMDNVKPTDELSVYYSHCGVIGKGRSIVIRNEKNEILKEWKFADAKGSDGGIIIKVQEILDLKKHYPNARFNMYYAAKELPEGRMLASINTQSKSTTRVEARTEPTTLIMLRVLSFMY